MNHFLVFGICYSSFLIAGGSLVGFCIFLISGSFQILPLRFGTAGTLAFDAALSLIFFTQHSGMLRKAFREKVVKIFPVPYYNAVYAIASGITLIFLLVFWQQSAVVIYETGEVLRWGIRGLFFITGMGFVWGAAALGGFDPFGIENIKRHLHGRPLRINPFIIKGPYRFVRHPLYSCLIIMLWLCPVLTADRLVFNILWSVWIVVGTLLEERDLVADFGRDYREYQEKVPMLLPLALFRKRA